MNPPPPRWGSLLFVAAHVETFVAHAADFGGNRIIPDLEDAVPAGCDEAMQRRQCVPDRQDDGWVVRRAHDIWP